MSNRPRLTETTTAGIVSTTSRPESESGIELVRRGAGGTRSASAGTRIRIPTKHRKKMSNRPRLTETTTAGIVSTTSRPESGTDLVRSGARGTSASTGQSTPRRSPLTTRNNPAKCRCLFVQSMETTIFRCQCQRNLQSPCKLLPRCRSSQPGIRRPRRPLRPRRPCRWFILGIRRSPALSPSSASSASGRQGLPHP